MGFIDTSEVRTFAADKLRKSNLFETAEMFGDVYCLEPGQSQKPHTHVGATKFYYVIEGHGTFLVGDRSEVLGPGGLAWAGPGELHGVENASSERLVLLVAMSPNPNMARGAGS